VGKASRKKKDRRAGQGANLWHPLEQTIITGGGVDGAEKTFDEVWANDLYTVLVRRGGPNQVTHLSLRRNDRRAVTDWRHKQYIKNQLCGPEREGIEIYPAESRLVDTSNQFHLWVLPEGEQIPFGYMTRLVSGGGESEIGSVQRPFEYGLVPDDARTPESISSSARDYLSTKKEKA